MYKLLCTVHILEKIAILKKLIVLPIFKNKINVEFKV